MTQLPVEEQHTPRMTPAVQWLIALNVVVFFLQFTLFGTTNMRDALGFRIAELPAQWWTIGSHMFVHGGFWTLLLNVYLLFVFGPRLEQTWGTRVFRNFFLWCGLGGWLAHVLFVRDATLVGATGAVLGVTVAYALRWPDEGCDSVRRWKRDGVSVACRRSGRSVVVLAHVNGRRRLRPIAPAREFRAGPA
jgi:membrane associated rhomboid family serine protease